MSEASVNIKTIQHPPGTNQKNNAIFSIFLCLADSTTHMVDNICNKMASLLVIPSTILSIHFFYYQCTFDSSVSHLQNTQQVLNLTLTGKLTTSNHWGQKLQVHGNINTCMFPSKLLAILTWKDVPSLGLNLNMYLSILIPPSTNQTHNSRLWLNTSLYGHLEIG